ncbi:MAG: TRAP transporter small permease subunit [Ferrovibrio sp.]|uniref:TRAP transporter small permease n=1 Tax=Ferrovibrio sp. TaxID=1917215 RepID=UPI00260BA0A2|nr:TRAP transporter small permease subunit [Ferrovibrio sp.]MCW0232582.1 TRAP transporter small permease subunit [Ferrovibrio sp.]
MMLVTSFGTVVGMLVLSVVWLALMQMLLRYTFVTSLPWVEDVSILLLLMATWLGSALLWMTRGHIAVTVLTDRLSTRTQAILQHTADVAVIFGGMGLAFSAQTAMGAFSGIEMGSLPFDSSVKYVPIMAGGGLLASAGCINLLCKDEII